MLIGLCGGLCAGKQTIANYLVENHSFSRLRLHASTENMHGSGHFKGHPTITEKLAGPTPSDHSFETIGELVDFVTSKWQQHCVTTNVDEEEFLAGIVRRPFFLLVHIDAPIHVRWIRSKTRSEKHGDEPLSLEEFVKLDDNYVFGSNSGLARCLDKADVRIINGTTSLSALHCSLEKVDLLAEERLRPTWDQYFMQLASLAAHRSNCMKRRVGCVLVREKRVISTGYNGTPRNLRNCNEGGCSRCNQGPSSGVNLATCLCLHAEENALLEAGRERIREGSILYCDTCPCLTCSIKIAQVGISEVVYSQGYSMDQMTASVLKEAGVKLRQFSPPQKGVVLAT